MRYDQLVLALGSVSRTLPIPGLAEHAVGFKTLADAIALRNRALLHLEIAESLEDSEKRREYLTFVFVGAGYAGVEGIAELQDMVADVIDRYPRCRIDGTRWILVERLDRIMPEIGPKLAEFATAELRGRGIEVRTGTSLDSGRGGRRHAVHRRAHPHPHGLLDRGRGAAAARARARPAARGRRAHRGGADAAREGPREHLGDRRHGRGARPIRGRRAADAADGPARAAPGAPCGRQRRRGARPRPSRARSATRRAACSWTWAGTRRSSRRRWCASAASPRGSRRGPTTC